MALTKVGKEGITGISNSSDATAITIDSSEKVGIGQSTPDAELHIGDGSGSSDNTRLRITGGTSGLSTIQLGDTASANIGQLQYDHSSNFLAVRVNGSERMRLLSGGGLTFNGDTAAANALDDYEEGTFTPSFTGGITGSSYEDQNGTYVKIGQLVFFALELDITNGAASANGNQIKIDNIPFVSAAASPMVYGQGGAWVTFNNGFYNVDTGIYLEIPTNTNQIRLYRGSGNSLAGNDTGVNAQNNLHIAGCYRTA